MKIELHILQNFPPANLNRDDTGSPKDCEFGGVRRGRVSSQCLKRSIRTSGVFQHTLANRIAIRTKQVDVPLAKALETHGFDTETAKLIAQAVATKMLDWDTAKNRTKVLFYVGRDEIEHLATAIAAEQDAFNEAVHALHAAAEDGKKAKAAAEKELLNVADNVKKAFTKSQKDHVGAADIALFGRMLANVPELKIDAACQVAHAISTNQIDQDFDYFTAVDDLNTGEETGAGMIGTTGFNSSCYYRYALMDADQLAKNLGNKRELAREAINAFLKASLEAIPTGKQNSFAAQTPPALFMAVVKSNSTAPWSLANAFVKPVRGPRQTGDPSLVAASITALDNHWGDLVDMYGSDDVQPFIKVLRNAGTLQHLKEAEQANAAAVISSVHDALATWAAEENA